MIFTLIEYCPGFVLFLTPSFPDLLIPTLFDPPILLKISFLPFLFDIEKTSFFLNTLLLLLREIALILGL